jgi:CBS domain-containing membrane protein
MSHSPQQPAFRRGVRRRVAEALDRMAHRLHHARSRREFRDRCLLAFYVFANGFVTTAILAGLAMITHTVFVFPSVGPTAFLLFFRPNAPAARPRNVLGGHAIGILCGYGSLWLLGLTNAPSAMREGVTVARMVAVALSLALTGAFMILLRTVHSPAGATTLIVSLGIIKSPLHLLIVEIAVALLAVQGMVLNRLELPPGAPGGGAGATRRASPDSDEEPTGDPPHDQAQTHL